MLIIAVFNINKKARRESGDSIHALWCQMQFIPMGEEKHVMTMVTKISYYGNIIYPDDYQGFRKCFQFR